MAGRDAGNPDDPGQHLSRRGGAAGYHLRGPPAYREVDAAHAGHDPRSRDRDDSDEVRIGGEWLRTYLIRRFPKVGKLPAHNEVGALAGQ